MTQIRVTYAQVPTDVLVWLVDHPGPQLVHDIALPLAIEHETLPADALVKVGRALVLLERARYVEHAGNGWWAMPAGVAAVTEARAQQS